MLSSIGRAAIKRIGVRPVRSALPGSWTTLNTETNTVPRTYHANSLRRLYATATKATQTIKKTKTVTLAEGIPAKPKRAAAKKTAKKVVKKPVKKPVKKVVKKKAVAKPKKKVPKEKTPEQLERVKIQAQKKKILDLKKIALLEGQPRLPSRSSARLQYLKHGLAGKQASSENLKVLHAGFAELDAAEHERLNQQARNSDEETELAYKSWIAAHTPDEIRLANNARSLLRKKSPTGKFPNLVDDRLPKGARNAYTYFTKERYSSGDVESGVSVAKGSRSLSKEWAALSPSQKQPYVDAAAADLLRYWQEYETVYKHPCPSRVEAAQA